MKTAGELERLAVLGQGIEVALDKKTLDEVADLCIRMHQERARRVRSILTPAQARSYTERDEVEREGMQAAVRNVIVALVVLDLIELPA